MSAFKRLLEPVTEAMPENVHTDIRRTRKLIEILETVAGGVPVVDFIRENKVRIFYVDSISEHHPQMQVFEDTLAETGGVATPLENGDYSVTLTKYKDPDIQAAQLAHEVLHLQHIKHNLFEPELQSPAEYLLRTILTDAAAYAFQAHIAFERAQIGHPQAWHHLEDNAPGITKAYFETLKKTGNSLTARAAAMEAFFDEDAFDLYANYSLYNVTKSFKVIAAQLRKEYSLSGELARHAVSALVEHFHNTENTLSPALVRRFGESLGGGGTCLTEEAARAFLNEKHPAKKLSKEAKTKLHRLNKSYDFRSGASPSDQSRQTPTRPKHQTSRSAPGRRTS